ncbi:MULTISPECIES: Crp/Fnr family transcriptional regulator [Marinobacter]|uniref:Crp/Fnr family transcriptional regulator n=1 Tax=Marinobacter TaxID=2742 RepID=UPI000DAE537A|nr:MULTISPECIES: Crp/Fnr family transcriptional regulator [Marinobacter]
MGKHNDVLVSSASQILNQPSSSSSSVLSNEIPEPYGWSTKDPGEGRARALRNSLARVLGWGMPDRLSRQRRQSLDEMAALFEHRTYGAEVNLENRGSTWKKIYLVEYGIARLYRKNDEGRVSIHHFFEEGSAIWPVFARTRSERNTLCLTTVTPCTVWEADFLPFRDCIKQEGEGTWDHFALALMEELAERATMREFERQTLSAEERYQIMVRDYPELVERVPDYQLAAWLGVATATYSRLKNGRSRRH